MTRQLSSSAGMEASYHDRSTKAGWTWARDVVTFGSTAIASQDADHPDIAFTRSDVGTFTVTYPYCYEADIYVSNLKSAAITVLGAAITAQSATAGTATIKTFDAAGAAADPATGDIITFTFRMRHRE